MSKKELTGIEYFTDNKINDISVESNFNVENDVKYTYKEKKKKCCGKCNCKKKINNIDDDRLIELNDRCFFRLNNIISYMVEDNLVLAIILKEYENKIRLYYNNGNELKSDLNKLKNAFNYNRRIE